jgi:hypothetical protein
MSYCFYGQSALVFFANLKFYVIWCKNKGGLGSKSLRGNNFKKASETLKKERMKSRDCSLLAPQAIFFFKM